MTTATWVRGSFRQAAHATLPGRRTLCGTPLGHGITEAIQTTDRSRTCKRCATIAATNGTTVAYVDRANEFNTTNR